MARTLDKILVVDLESTCWEGEPPVGEISEIIQVGICMVDVATLERQGKRSILVRPSRSRISGFCTKLTGLLPEMFVEGAMELNEAVRILRKEYQSKDRL